MATTSTLTKALLQDDRPIRIEASPYTYVRTIVMESRLFSKSEYAKLLKMQLSEIIQFLEESTYKYEIDELAMTEQGVQLVEHAVNRNFRRAVEKLRHISDGNMRFLIDVYLWRNDLQNVKTVLRAKHSAQSKERVANLIVPGTIAKEQLLEAYGKQSVEDALRSLDLPFMSQREALAAFSEHGLSGLEAALTLAYYSQTLSVAARIKGEEGQGNVMREFLLLEVDAVNLLTILKLKHENISPSKIEEHIIREQHRALGQQGFEHQARQRLQRKLIEAKSVDDAFAILQRSRSGRSLAQAREEYARTGSLLSTERELQRTVLRRATLLTHQHPLSVDVVLGYLFAKVTETRNIFMLIKGKQLCVSEQILESELIVS